MNEQTTRWDAFTSSELQALDELLRSFGAMRAHNPAISELGKEIASTMQRRRIIPFGTVDPKPRGGF